MDGVDPEGFESSIGGLLPQGRKGFIGYFPPLGVELPAISDCSVIFKHVKHKI